MVYSHPIRPIGQIMKIFHNTHHAQHAGRQEMFRGRLVDCHEVPDRLRYVLDELQRRPVGQLMTPDAALDVHAAMARVHAPDYLAFLARAWDDWVAQDPANAERDALPSVWPLASKHAFRTDSPPRNRGCPRC
jgi:acetoin utilization deacetylase AcuC-like enzyme